MLAIAGVEDVSAAPQPLQNLAPGSLARPHPEQITSRESAFPQPLQKTASVGFS
jgi:hypothetical protein